VACRVGNRAQSLQSKMCKAIKHCDVIHKKFKTKNFASFAFLKSKGFDPL